MDKCRKDAKKDTAVLGGILLTFSSQNKQFKEYLADINKEGSAAQKDYEGYKAALNLVNDASSNADVTNQILNKGYNDGELSALLQQAMNQEVNN